MSRPSVFRGWRRADGNRLDQCELTEPSLEDSEVAIDVEAVALTAADAYGPVGVSPGGAIVGTVRAAGENASAALGKRVLIGRHVPCGECELCRRGFAVHCPDGATLGIDRDGGLATVVAARARWLCVLEGELAIDSPAAAVLGGPVADGYAMFARAGVGPGDVTVVLGTNPLARALIAIAKCRGAKTIDVDPSAMDALASTRKRAEQLSGAAKPWTIFVTETGALSLAIQLATIPGTSIVCSGNSGISGDKASATTNIDVGPLLEKSITIVGVAGAHPDLLPEIAALAVRGDISVEELTTRTTPSALSSLSTDLAAAERRGVALLVVFD